MVENKETPLIDNIYKLLWRARERAYSKGYQAPKFQIYISHSEHDQLRREALNSYVFTIKPPAEFLFGHQLIVVDETPYVRLVE